MMYDVCSTIVHDYDLDLFFFSHSCLNSEYFVHVLQSIVHKSPLPVFRGTVISMKILVDFSVGLGFIYGPVDICS